MVYPLSVADTKAGEINMRFLRICLIVHVVFLLGCASGAPIISTTKIIQFPERNERVRQELGDTLVSYIKSTSLPSLRLLKSLEGKHWGFTAAGYPIPAGTVLEPRHENDRWVAFNDPKERPLLCLDKKKNRLCDTQNIYGNCPGCGFGVGSYDSSYFERAEYVDLRQPNLRMELIYNGTVDNSVRFLYRELSSGYMRDAFSQEVQYDLNESKEIGFKGARLLIHNATNRNIEYEVLEHFEIAN